MIPALHDLEPLIVPGLERCQRAVVGSARMQRPVERRRSFAVRVGNVHNRKNN
jgi:hypothetical protein